MAATSSVALVDWHPYSGGAAISLAILLLLVTAGLFFLGTRTTSARLPRPGRGLKAILVLVWVASILLVLPLFKEIAVRSGQSALGTGPVLPITLGSALVTFIAVAYATRGGGVGSALGNGFAAAVAGPMVFELPFLLIITPNVTTKVPHPLFLFATFLLVILTTLALPTFSSKFSIGRYSLYSLGAMFAVFAVWALATGYAPPGDPISFSLNAISKILGFAAVAMGFLRFGNVRPPAA